MAGKKTKDLTPKSPGQIKGGGKPSSYAGNDNITLLRGAKPTKRDLPPRKDVKGGKKAP